MTTGTFAGLLLAELEMEHLDSRENDHDTCEYTIIGGSSCTLVRAPSSLMNRSDPSPSSIPPPHSHTHTGSCPRCTRGRAKRGCFAVSSNSSSIEEGVGSRSSSGLGNAVVFRWDEEDILAWLKEIGMDIYEGYFKKHSIKSGEILVSLTEEHLKEMGVVSVGHRVELSKAIEDLRRECGLVPRDNYTDVTYLIHQMNVKQLKNTISLYPKRIILIRHGESEGNVDNKLYAVKPDRKMELTPLGRKQAYAAGFELKHLVQEESVCFYVSPFVRSRQTYEQLRQSFNDEQVLHVREDPRIREQEWGNFQDPSTMIQVMVERRKVGSFYYRFLTGESGADVYDRVSTFLETLYRDMEKGGCGENAIMVSHGLFCRLFLMRYFHWKVERFHKLWNFENCQYAVMEKQPGGHYRLVSELKSDP